VWFGRPIRKFTERSAALSRLKISDEHEVFDYKSPYSEKLWIHIVKSSPLYSALRRGRVRRRLDAMNRSIRDGQEVPVESRDWYCGSYSTIGILGYRCLAYDGDVLFFQCGACYGKEVQLTGWWDSPFLGYEEICLGRFEGYVLGGAQVDLLKHARAAEIIMEKIRSACAVESEGIGR
jgi:hypothetical protein